MEGHDIAAGTTDVIVTDGFTGNVALKTAEGALKLIGDLLRQVFTGSAGGEARLSAGAAEPGAAQGMAGPAPLQRCRAARPERRRREIAWRHGRPGFAHAVDVAMDMVVHRFNDRIRDGLARLADVSAAASAAAAPAGGGSARVRRTGRDQPASGRYRVGGDEHAIHSRGRRFLSARTHRHQ